ncbi:MAG: DEAD/DEAH box helicase [Lachnospirales bacterium]
MVNNMDFELCNKYKEVLEKAAITSMTDVQKIAIPKIKAGNDLIVVSETGSGKTLTYLLPLMESVDKEIKTPQILILAPTHELSSQIHRVVKMFRSDSMLLVGGMNLKKQIDSLKERPKIIIGSNGRILELIRLKKLKMHTIKTIVLDEGDRLLDDDNIEDTKKVIKTTLKERQILYFSASINKDTENELKLIMKSPETIKLEMTLPSKIEHFYIECKRRDKVDALRKIIYGMNIPKTIIFVNNPVIINDIVNKLNYHKLNTLGLFGSKNVGKRNSTIIKFKEQNIPILVTSDLTSRGLDIDNVELVINYDVPDPTFYQHRCGRTGRIGKSGICISLASATEIKFLENIKETYSINIERKKMAYGKLVNS